MKVDDAFVFVLMLNALLFMFQLGVVAVNPEAPIYININDTHIGQLDQGDYTLSEDVTVYLPEGEGSVSPETGNFFTDIFATIKNWLLGSTGGQYLLLFITAFPSFLKIMAIPPAISFAIGAIWYATGIILIIMFLRGA